MKLEFFLVFALAIIAIVGVVYFVYYAFPDTLVGQAIFGIDDCGCVDVQRSVCGVDGQAYKNNCVAECFSVTVAHDGYC